MKADPKVLSELQATLEAAAEGLPKVTGKKMFGCHALWADGNVFALVWKEGRIGLRLPDEKAYDKLMASSGAVPWKAGKMTMSHWVLVPEALPGKKAEFSRWLKAAHMLALAAPSKPKKQ